MPVMPVTQTSGNVATMPGSREAYENYGIPPVMYQPASPYATTAYRTGVDPYGNMTVQPLIGFPSVYPHVVSGVATSPEARVGGRLASLIAPYVQPVPVAVPRAAAGGGQPTQPAPQRQSIQPAVARPPLAPSHTPTQFSGGTVVPAQTSATTQSPQVQPRQTVVAPQRPSVPRATSNHWVPDTAQPQVPPFVGPPRPQATALDRLRLENGQFSLAPLSGVTPLDNIIAPQRGAPAPSPGFVQEATASSAQTPFASPLLYSVPLFSAALGDAMMSAALRDAGGTASDRAPSPSTTVPSPSGIDIPLITPPQGTSPAPRPVPPTGQPDETLGETIYDILQSMQREQAQPPVANLPVSYNADSILRAMGYLA